MVQTGGGEPIAPPLGAPDISAGLEGGRHMPSTFVTAVVNYLHRCGGDALVERVRSSERVRRAPAPCATWADRDAVVALAEEAARVCGEPEMGRRAGEELFRLNMADAESLAIVRAAGDPARALEAVLQFATRLARGRTYRIVTREPGRLVVEGTSAFAEGGHPFFCGLNLGYWSQLPSVFGGVGFTTHPECEYRGGERCLYTLSWEEPASLTPSESDGEDLTRYLASFDRVQQVGETLARASDLRSLCERIVEAVDSIAPAPGILVALRAEPGAPIVQASRGLLPGATDLVAQALVAPGGDARPSGCHVIEIGRFGALATFAPESSAVPDSYARHLESFSRHAAARVEAVIARQQAENSRRTFQALLLLAGNLAEAATSKEVCECVARAVPTILGSDSSAVLLWDEDGGCLRPVAHVGPVAPVLPAFGTGAFPEMSTLISAGRPSRLVIERRKAPEVVARAMQGVGEELNVVVPIVDKGELRGVISAGFGEADGRDSALAAARLQGVAAVASPAFAKARLLEEISHRALHDPLTGLPNRTLLEDRVHQALLEAHRHGHEVGLLFVDLDHFKSVNDHHGHEVGDVLLRSAAARIREALRGADTLARVGGDEFVIVVPGLANAAETELVADRVLEKLEEPFLVAGHRFSLSASIGISVFPEDGDGYGALLHKADQAMYRAKSGVGRVHLDLGAVERSSAAPLG